MNPNYITIHSTGDPRMKASEYAVAMTHGLRSVRRAGASGAGRLSWHFTVDGGYAIQHLSTSVQGGHADFNGPGNRTSIGIEMCEYTGVSLNAVMDRTARLTAYLMWKHRIPLSHVVPHYHWARPGMKPCHKACPHFLMDGGKPGPKWTAFKNRVNAHYRRLNAG
jgi:N-acetylmuramoyl-L-alanine amidase